MDDSPVSIEIKLFEVDQHPVLEDVARQFAKALGYTADLEVDPALAQLLRLRVSQVSNCTYCLNLHYEVARNLGIHRSKIDTLIAWWETDLFEPSEQAALAYTEALTRIADATVKDSLRALPPGTRRSFFRKRDR